MRFSVVIPFYDSVDTIEDSLESCILQSYQDYEIILVDDGSSRNSDSIIASYIKSYPEATIKWVRLLANSGVSNARNFGLNIATGEYIAFMDADDVWHPKKLELMATLIQTFPSYGLYFHDSVIDSIMPDIIRSSNDETEQVCFFKFLIKNPAHTPCVVVRNEPAVWFCEDMRYSEDYDLWLKLAFSRGALRVKQPLTSLGRPVGSSGGLSANRWQMRLGEMRAYLRLYRLNPLFLLLSPVLIAWSLIKHLRSILVSRS